MMYRRPRSICCCCNRCYMHRPLITSCAVFICDNTFNPANANAHTEVERNAIHLLLVAELLLMTQFACLLLSCRTPIERLKGFICMIIVPESFYILISNTLFTASDTNEELRIKECLRFTHQLYHKFFIPIHG